MNDPFDMLPVFKKPADPRVIREYLERNSNRLGFCGTITAKMVADWKARWDQVLSDPLRHWTVYAINTRVLCLSQRNNGVLLWSHYANYHRGFAVGFNSEVLIETEPSTLFFEVDYGEERPVFDITKIQQEQAEAKDMLPFFKRKSREWSYENEWRAIHRPASLKNQEFLPFTQHAVSCLILGPLINKASVDTLREACDLGGLDRVPLKRARISKSLFELEISHTTWEEASSN